MLGPYDEGICFEGFGGVSWQWDSKPVAPAANCSGNFPRGWAAFAKEIELPFMLHISEWAGAKYSGEASAGRGNLVFACCVRGSRTVSRCCHLRLWQRATQTAHGRHGPEAARTRVVGR